MRKALLALVAAALLLCVTAALYSFPSEIDEQLMAKRRVFEPLGPGLREIRRGPKGNYYILAGPSVGLVIFDPKGRRLFAIGGAPSPDAGFDKPGRPPIAFGEDCDVDTRGNIYIADRANNLVTEFSPTGNPLRSFSVQGLVSLAALPDEEVAVTTLQRTHLVTIYGPNGKIAREFGEPESVSSRADLDQIANRGRVSSDPQGHIYLGFTYMPEPLVRQYDRFGYAGQSFEFTGLDAYPEASAVRKEIERQEEKNIPASLRPTMTAFGVDPVGGDVWMGLHNTLVHFDKDGIRRSEYQIYAPKGARLEASLILVQEDSLLIGADPLGIYEFERPDKRH
jgi:hypothetical protein